MFDLLKALIYGAVQGVSEFLPISSSGHLVLLHKYLPLPLENELFFDVALHLATLAALIWFFHKDIGALVRAWLDSFKGGKTAEGRLAWLILLATVPAAVAGFLIASAAEEIRQARIVVIMLATVGTALILAEIFGRKKKEMDNITLRQALVIGLAQAIALIPGVSRSGITIAAALMLGFKREAAVRFSFLLAIPIIAGASLKEIGSFLTSKTAADELLLLAPAFAAALAAGFLAIKYLLVYSRRYSLIPFGIYRLALAGLIALLFLF